MKIIYRPLFALLFLSLFFTSCFKDLDTLPLTDNILTPENAWADPASYEQFTSKIYASFAISGNEGPAGLPDLNAADQGEATFLRTYWNLQELGTDEVIGAWDNETLRGLQFNQWNSGNNFLLLNYTRIYLSIAYANEFLSQTTEEKLNARNVSPEIQDQVGIMRNEVKALRALAYYFLMDLYGNIPFITEEQGIGAYLPEQKDRTFFFSWIESELKSVEGKLPEHSTDNYGRINDPTIWMILSRMYLNAEEYTGQPKYTECLTYLNKILGAGYELDPVYKNMFGADNHRSKEIIYSIVYDGLKASTYGGTTYLCAASYKSDMNPVDNFGFSQAWSGIRAKEPLSDAFTGNDNRALFWKTDRSRETATWYDFSQGWGVVKFTNKNSDGSNGSNNVFADTDFPLFRLADAYLMYAEAVLRGGSGGSQSTALNYINELRTRAGASQIGEEGLNLDFILNERMRELYWEGHRRTDLIRFGKFTKNYAWPWKNGVYGGTSSIDEKYKLYPLPATEISANPKLVQNPGF